MALANLANLRSLIIVATCVIAQTAFSVIQIDTGPMNGGEEWTKKLHAGIEKAIGDGAWDGKNLKFPVIGNDGQLKRLGAALIKTGDQNLIKISSTTFADLPAEVRSGVVGNLASLWEDNSTYKAWVGTKDNDLKNEPTLIRLGVQFDTLGESVWAESLLSSFAQTWAKKWSTFQGPNCYHASMASIFGKWDKPRYMRPEELLCHQRTHFESIEKAEKWGDMVSFDDAQGVPIHAFTYLGSDRQDPKRSIVFTKNGYAVSPYLFMTFTDVYAMYQGFTIARIRYYRAKQEAVDPSTDATAPCYREYMGQTWADSDAIADAAIESGLKKKPSTTFAPIPVK